MVPAAYQSGEEYQDNPEMALIRHTAGNLMLTVWKDGSYLCQSVKDDLEVQMTTDWFVSIPLAIGYHAPPPTAPATHTAILRALLEALECRDIDGMMRADPELVRAVGKEIARAARLGRIFEYGR